MSSQVKDLQPIWRPSPERQNNSQMLVFMKWLREKHQVCCADYQSLHRFSVKVPERFWQLLSDFLKISYRVRPKRSLQEGKDMLSATWFEGAQLNFAENLLVRRDAHTALIAYTETGARRTLSYADLYEAVGKMAAAMRALGIGACDRVVCVLPNCLETVIAMLATSSIGAIWSSCSPDFGTGALLDRFQQLEPKLLLACDCYEYKGQSYPCLDKIEQIQKALPSLLQTVVVSAQGQPVPSYCTYHEFVQGHQARLEFAALPFNHPLYIMFSSGTTGRPKCIVHGAGNCLIQHLKELRLHTDIGVEDRFCYYTTCGWMMWNWMISALATGATLILYDGSPFYPRDTQLMDLVERERLTVLGVSASYISALEKKNIKPCEGHDLSSLKTLLATGSPLLHGNFDYVYRWVKKDLCLSSISGGTDIISCFALGCPMIPVYRGEIQCVGLGMDVHFFDHNGRILCAEKGELVCCQSFPSTPLGFWNDEQGHAYRQAYFSRFPGCWAHGDFGALTDHGGVIIYGRSDTTLNPGGVRIGSAEIYRQLERFSEILESVVVEQKWQQGSRIVLFVVLREGFCLSPELQKKIRESIKVNTTARHVPKKIIQVLAIPKTQTGKVSEAAVKCIVNRKPIENLGALANPEALGYFKDLKELSS